jgi:hypothetical protein
MKVYQGEQIIGQLEERKGGYFYLKIEAKIINGFEQKRYTRFLCTLDNQLTFACGINHSGDGNFFIMPAGKSLITDVTQSIPFGSCLRNAQNDTFSFFA